MHNLEFLAVGVIVGGVLGFAYYTKAATRLRALKQSVTTESVRLEVIASKAESAVAGRVRESVKALRKYL